MTSKSRLFNLFLFFLAIVTILSSVAIYKAYVVLQPCKHTEFQPLSDSNRIKVDEKVLNRFKQALSLETVSYDFLHQNSEAIQNFVKLIKSEFSELETYPYVKLSLINNASLLYEITGKDKSLKPYLLAAHFDVVPADKKKDKWTYEPFSAELDDNKEFIYSRGTLDDKGSMISQLEAIKVFLKKNGQPSRTIFLAYGHDEELSGHFGALKIAEHLNNTQLEFVLDEGTMIVEDLFPGLDRPVAYISVADKGYLSIKFYVNLTAGHSSMPNANENSLFILADAITKLKNNKVPSRLGSGPEVQLFEQFCVHFGFFKRVVLANIWLFKPIIKMILSLKPTTDALQRTSTAVTVFQGGIKDNVIPAYAEFIVNHRIHSSQSCSEILDYDLNLMGDDRIKYEILRCVEPSPLSPIDSLGFSLIKHTVKQIFPDSIQIPSVMLGLTDSRYYNNLTKNVYKFLPIKLKNDDLKRYHGIDERISIKNYEDLINFYFMLFVNSDKVHLQKRENIHFEL